MRLCNNRGKKWDEVKRNGSVGGSDRRGIKESQINVRRKYQPMTKVSLKELYCYFWVTAFTFFNKRSSMGVFWERTSTKMSKNQLNDPLFFSLSYEITQNEHRLFDSKQNRKLLLKFENCSLSSRLHGLWALTLTLSFPHRISMEVGCRLPDSRSTHNLDCSVLQNVLNPI